MLFLSFDTQGITEQLADLFKAHYAKWIIDFTMLKKLGRLDRQNSSEVIKV